MSNKVTLKGQNFTFTVDTEAEIISRPLNPDLYENWEYRSAEELLRLLILAHMREGVNIQDPGYVRGLDFIIGQLKTAFNFSDEALVLNAEELFLALDKRESQDA